jgi:hypothetical protein
MLYVLEGVFVLVRIPYQPGVQCSPQAETSAYNCLLSETILDYLYSLG